MQLTNTRRLSDVRAWVELTYSSLRVESYIIFAVIGMMIALMCAGAYQEGVRQGLEALGIAQEAAVAPLVGIVNQYGLSALVAFCYFSNVTGAGTRREMAIDALTIAVGFLMPQLVFHATWLRVTHEQIMTANMAVSAASVNTITVAWLTVWALSMALVGVAYLSWRVLRRVIQ